LNELQYPTVIQKEQELVEEMLIGMSLNEIPNLEALLGRMQSNLQRKVDEK